MNHNTSITTADPPLPFVIQYIGTNTLQLFKGNDKWHVAYQLLVINNSPAPIQIKSIKIKPFHSSLTTEQIALAYSSLSQANTLQPQNPLLQPSESGIIYFFLNFKHSCDVLHLQEFNNWFIIETENKPQTLQLIVPKPLYIDEERPIVLSPPLRGEKYYASGGPSNTSGHRRTIITFNGQLLLPEQYAIDFIQYDTNGFYRNEGKSNSDFVIYNEKVLAVDDGVVVRTVDGIQENVPFVPPPLSTLNTISGNFILLKLKSNHYVMYAHLIPGSILVKAGDKVKRKEVLARVGNSGNSGAPHLHFQITDKPEPVGLDKLPNPLNAQGRPWLFDHFQRLEYRTTKQHPTIPVPDNVIVDACQTVRQQIVMDQNLVTFA